MENPVRVMLVDDDAGKLDSLKRQLENSQDVHFRVFPFTCPYDAYAFVLQNPSLVEFAFVDHVLVADRPSSCPAEVPKMASGIDLTRAISRRWPHIGIILYSGDEKITEEDEWEGLAAGAHRYVHVAPPQSLLDVATKEFISEIRELRELQAQLEQFHQQERNAEVLQRSIQVGVDLIDRRFKVWYRNPRDIEIEGESSHANTFCCSCFHDRSWPPCRGCLVWEGLGLSREQWEAWKGKIDRIFYSPVHPNAFRTFKYMHVWAEPVYGFRQSEQPIAVVESVIDLTDSPTIEQMSLEENLDILLRAVTELTCEWIEPKHVPISRDGTWNTEDKRAGYVRARVFRADSVGPAPAIRLLRKCGEHDLKVPDNEVVLPLKKRPRYPENGTMRDRAVRIQDLSEFVDHETLRGLFQCEESPFNFALFNDRREWIGWLALDGDRGDGSSRALTDRDAELLGPYAEEVARVLQNKLGINLISPEANRILETVRLKIVLAKTAEEALQTVVDGIVGQCGIEMAHIREVRNNTLVLAAGRGYYYDHADRIIPADSPTSQSRIVAAAGLPIIINERPDPRIDRSIESLPPHLRTEMGKLQSIGLFPLAAFGRVEAVLNLHSTKKHVFTGETVSLCVKLAEIASYAFHDIRLAAETEQKISDIWKTAAASFAHWIGNILPIAQNRLEMIHDNPKAPDRVIQDTEVALDSVDRALEITNGVKSYGHWLPLSLVPWQFVDLICDVVQHCQDCYPKLSITLGYHHRDKLVPLQIQADDKALKDIFLSFVSDSIEFHPKRSPKIKIECELRSHGRTQTVIVAYCDDGPGVAPENKAAIFEPFFTTRDKGTGIGLALAKHVIQSHNGAIQENGRYGEGVRFEIELPIT
jgi:signal transduction histidine kinase/CheY-like chemotaxis protein